jgi:translation initiation factor 2B subunit (eIF-2B alpha/beta/delta family)
MDNVNMPIAEGAQEHVHSDECIMALGDSHTLELFLKAAAKRRRFQVAWVITTIRINTHATFNTTIKCMS